jgi:hypothetical protein
MVEGMPCLRRGSPASFRSPVADGTPLCAAESRSEAFFTQLLAHL